MMFNSQPILTQQVVNRPAAATSAIAAGPRPKPPSKHDRSDNTISVFKTGDPYMDPWMKQKPHTPAVSKEATLMTAATAKAPQEASQRQPDGPIQEMFQQQDNRIQAIETAMTQLQATQQQKATDTDAKLTQLGQTLSQHMTLSSQNFDQIYTEQKSMTQSIAQAMQRQDDRLAQSMDELKALFLQSRGIKRPPAESTGDMEDQE